MMRLGALLLLLASTILPASAADLWGRDNTQYPFGLKDGPMAAGTFSWTGFYVGVNGSYGRDDNSFRDTISVLGGRATETLTANYKALGWALGVEAGYNYQLGGTLAPYPIVIGLETDTSISNISDTSTAVQFACIPGRCVNLATGPAHSAIDWFGTTHGRLGFVMFNQQMLIFGTGGLAYGGVSENAATAMSLIGAGDTRFGWEAGAGLEYKFSPAWSLKFEWQHIDLGSTSLGGVFGTGFSTVHAAGSDHNEFDVVKLGVRYQLY